MKHSRTLQAFLAAVLLGSVALAGGSPTGSAITTLKVGVDGGNQNDFAYYGQSGGIAAYSIATTSCNPGTQTVIWTSSNHPVIGQNIFRLKDGRFEQLGQSWLKHGFCAVNESGCGSCQTTPCSSLGIGCADTYWASLNDGQGGGPKHLVNAATGVSQNTYPSPTGPSTIRGRLQVLVSEIDPAQNTGAVYFAEGQYVSADTAADGNASIANSWRRLNVVAVGNVDGGGPTVVGEPGVYAWKSIDPAVTVFDAYTSEGPAGAGRFTIGYKVTDLGGSYRYDYVVQNLTSDRSGYSFAVPAPPGTAISNAYFRDVDYHSGEPYSNVDWTSSHAGGMYTWQSTQTHATNQNANALRWGTMYSFGFESTSPPQNGTAKLALFKPGGGPGELQFTVSSPVGEPPVGTAYCSGDGTGENCPCFNFGDADHGCSNSDYFEGCALTADGSSSVSSNDLVLVADMAVTGQPGLFFQANNQVAGGDGVFYGDGLRCAGGGLVRLQTVGAGAGGHAESSVSITGVGGATAGDTRHFQFWYRDPTNSPCGAGFNLSNGYTIQFTN